MGKGLVGITGGNEVLDEMSSGIPGGDSEELGVLASEVVIADISGFVDVRLILESLSDPLDSLKASNNVSCLLVMLFHVLMFLIILIIIFVLMKLILIKWRTLLWNW